MSRGLVGVVAALLVGAVSCGDDGATTGPPPSSPPPGGLSLELSHPEPLRARAPVAWTLEVRNTGPDLVTLTFPSGQDGDVVLTQDGQERYRWSRGRVFTQALRTLALAAGQARSFTLTERSLEVAAGRYEVMASLASQPAPAAVRRSVRLEA